MSIVCNTYMTFENMFMLYGYCNFMLCMCDVFFVFTIKYNENSVRFDPIKGESSFIFLGVVHLNSRNYISMGGSLNMTALGNGDISMGVSQAWA